MISVVRYFIIILVTWLLQMLHVFAQEKPLIQVSGVIYNADTSRTSVPFATVYNKGMKLGNYANTNGFYTTMARAGDTIVISCIGYVDYTYAVPADYTEETFVYHVPLASRSYLLTEAVIYPWGTRDQFRRAFLYMAVPDDDLARSQKNLDPYSMQLAAAGLPRDAREMYSSSSMAMKNSYYTKGQVPQNNLLNPLAWAQFFNDLSSGKLKLQR